MKPKIKLDPGAIKGDGFEIGTTTTPLLPGVVDGFSVSVGIGPYPPDAPKSHRKAVYAELLPTSDEAREMMKAKNRERILGMVALTPAGAEAIAAEPGGEIAEKAATDALRAAVRLLRKGR